MTELKSGKIRKTPAPPILEETWHSYNSPPLVSLAVSVYLCQRATGNGTKTEEIALERFDYPVHGACTQSHIG